MASRLEPPETRYVRLGDADVAYQVVGDGPLDLVYCRGTAHVEVLWEHPTSADFLRRLASFSRLILFDGRGWGASDPFPGGGLPTWEGWAEDLAAVLDAVGSESVALFGEAEAGPICLLCAASHPERVPALILGNTTARALVDDDYPVGFAAEFLETAANMIEQTWGSPDLVRFAIPSRADDKEFLRWAAKLRRASATPRLAAMQYRYMMENVEVRSALSLIQVPTLVLHNTGNPLFPAEHGRYLANHIASAKFVEYPSDDAFFYADRPELVLDDIAQFLTGQRPPVEIERILTTVLFTDIVGSTERAAAIGDRKWRHVLDAHDRVVRDQLRRFQGHEINTTGDGFLASFDGPARAIRCAMTIVEALKPLGLDVRAGLHTGECEVRGDDLGGLAVHIAARVGARAAPGEVLVSGTVKDLVIGSGIDFDDRGEQELKGVPGAWRLYAVQG